MKLCPKIFLEGTRPTHKTDIAFALDEHPRIGRPRKYRYHSPFISTKWCGFTNFPWGRGLVNLEPQEEALAFGPYRTWQTPYGQLRFYSWIVDRYHISTQVYQSINHAKNNDFTWLESGRKDLSFRLIFTNRGPDSSSKAREQRFKDSGKPSLYDDLQVFVDEQEVMERFVELSSKDRLDIDISDDEVDHAAMQVSEWLEQTNGLYIT